VRHIPLDEEPDGPPWLRPSLDHGPFEIAGLRPAVASPQDTALSAVAIAAALTSIAALLLHAAGLVRMPYTVTFLSIPGAILLVSLAVWAGLADRSVFFNRLAVGFLVGALGLLAYDAIRWTVQAMVPLGFDAFFSIKAFGSLITRLPIDNPVSIAAGWSYHVSNGLSFGVLYALIAGPARPWYGLIWGLILEIAMLVVYPALFQPTSVAGFVLVSVVGHAAFGSVIGLGCRRWAITAARRA
jgi:hypothetical protein